MRTNQPLNLIDGTRERGAAAATRPVATKLNGNRRSDILELAEGTAADVYSFSQFPQFDSAYWGMGIAQGSMLYLGLCTHKPGASAGFFRFDPTVKRLELLFTLDQIVKTPPGSLAQGKIHTNLCAGSDGKLYFATHFAYPHGIPQDIKYEGGRLMSFDPLTQQVEDYGVLVEGEGIVTMILDSQTMHCYAVTALSHDFVDYSIGDRKVVGVTRVANSGGISRALGLDAAGNVYGSCEPFRVFKYNPRDRKLSFPDTNFAAISNRAAPEWASASRGGANLLGRYLWRCVEFDDDRQLFYGVNSSTCGLFEFDPAANHFRNVADVQSSEADRVHPTLTLTKRPNGNYYYTPANGLFDYCRSEDIQTPSSLVSFDARSQTFQHHGSIVGPDGQVVYGALGAKCSEDGYLYLLGAASSTKRRGDAFRFGDTTFDLALMEIDVERLRARAPAPGYGAAESP